MIVFYDNDFSTCAQKVRMLLNERHASRRTEWLDLRRGDQFDPSYLELNPNGVVPTIIDGSTVVIESTLAILEVFVATHPECGPVAMDCGWLAVLAVGLRIGRA